MSKNLRPLDLLVSVSSRSVRISQSHTGATQWHSVDWRCLVSFDHVHGRHCGVSWTGKDWDPALVGYAGQVSSTPVVVLQPLFAQLWGGKWDEEEGEGREGKRGEDQESRRGYESKGNLEQPTITPGK